MNRPLPKYSGPEPPHEPSLLDALLDDVDNILARRVPLPPFAIACSGANDESYYGCDAECWPDSLAAAEAQGWTQLEPYVNERGEFRRDVSRLDSVWWTHYGLCPECCASEPLFRGELGE